MEAPTPAEIEDMKLHFFQTRQPNLRAVFAFSVAIAYLGVILRIIARLKARVPFKADDWLIMIGLGLYTCFIIGAFYMVHFGLGLHIIRVTNAEALIKVIVVSQSLYTISVAPVKLSILALYRRLFPSKTLEKLSIATAFLILGYVISTTISFCLQCIPLSAMWTPGAPATCIHLTTMLTVTCSINVVTDVILVILPIPFLWNLHINRTRKLQLIGTFLLGGIVCIFSILRTVFVGYATPTDATWTDVQPTIWSALELGIGILCACLPTLRPLFVGRPDKVPTGSSGAVLSGYGQNSTLGNNRSTKPMSRKMGSQLKGEDERGFVQLEDLETAHSSLDDPKEYSNHSRSQPRQQRDIRVTTDINVQNQNQYGRR